MNGPLVQVRCYRCGRVLAEVDSAPADWSGVLRFRRCMKCDVPSPGRIADVLVVSDREGFALIAEVPYKALRGAIAKAQRTGKTQRHEVRVSERNAPS